MSEGKFRGMDDATLHEAHRIGKKKYIHYADGGWRNLADNQLTMVNEIHDEIKRREEAKLAEDYDEWGNYIGSEKHNSLWKRMIKWLAS